MVPVFRAYGEVGDGMSRCFTDVMSAGRPDASLRVLIDSSGGLLASAVWVYGYLNGVVERGLGTVETVVVGDACSAAALLLAAGSPGHRYVLPDSRVMVHQPHLNDQCYAQVADMPLEEGVGVLADKMWLGLMEYTNRLGARSLLAPDGWRAMMDDGKDHWLTPMTCVMYGLADHVGAPRGLWRGEGPY